MLTGLNFAKIEIKAKNRKAIFFKLETLVKFCFKNTYLSLTEKFLRTLGTNLFPLEMAESHKKIFILLFRLKATKFGFFLYMNTFFLFFF